MLNLIFKFFYFLFLFKIFLACHFPASLRVAGTCKCRSDHFAIGDDCRPCKAPCDTCSSEEVCITLTCIEANNVYKDGLVCKDC